MELENLEERYRELKGLPPIEKKCRHCGSTDIWIFMNNKRHLCKSCYFTNGY